MTSDKPTPLLQPSIPLYASLYLCGVRSQAGQGSSKWSLLSFSHSLPSLLHPHLPLLLHLLLLFPPSMPSFHSTAPCVLSTVGHASSERQGEHSALVLTPVQVNTPSSPLLLLFLPDPSSLWGSSSQLSVLPGPALLSHCYQTPALFTVLFLLYLMPTSNHCHLLFLPCNPLLALPSITGSNCPLSLPCMSQTYLAVPLSPSLSVHLSPLLSSFTTPHTTPLSPSLCPSSITHLIFFLYFSPIFLLFLMKRSVCSKPGNCSSSFFLSYKRSLCSLIFSTPPVPLSLIYHLPASISRCSKLLTTLFQIKLITIGNIFLIDLPAHVYL